MTNFGREYDDDFLGEGPKNHNDPFKMMHRGPYSLIQ